MSKYPLALGECSLAHFLIFADPAVLGVSSSSRQAGVPQERVLIKTPATWEGIRATERLEREGIRCLVTLVCSRVQGRAAAEAGASVIATCESLRFNVYR